MDDAVRAAENDGGPHGVSQSGPVVVRTSAELQELVGARLGPTEWFVIDQPRIDAFAEATLDFQWIHVDPERARETPFGSTIAHGYLTVALLPKFAAELITIKVGAARLNYGMNKLRFPAPVLVGSALRATATIVAVDEIPAGVLVTTNYVLETDDGGKPACVADALTLVVRHADPSPSEVRQPEGAG